MNEARSVRRYRPMVWAFITVLILFLVVADLITVAYTHNMLLTTFKEQARYELELISIFIRESLIKRDYATVEHFIEKWGEEHPSIVQIQAISPNGFSLAGYARQYSEDHILELEQAIVFDGNELITLKVTNDLSGIDNVLSGLSLRLIFIAVLLTTGLTIVIWYVLRILAIVPLEKEIVRREQAEKRLANHLSERDSIIEQRTNDLELANRELKREIANRQRAEEVIREKEERERSLLDSTAEAIFGIDRQGNCIFANRACLRLLGYDRESGLLGKHIHALIHHRRGDETPYPEKECPIYDAIRLNKRMHSTDEFLRRADGSSFPIEFWSYPILRNSVVVGAVVTFLDITERIEAELEMRKLSSAMEQTADAIVITNREGIIEYVNPAFEKTTGYREPEVLGKTPSIISSGQHQDIFYQRLWKTIQAGEVFREVFLNRRKNGQLYHEEQTITPLKDNTGNITHFISTGRDITERVSAEEQLSYLAHHDFLTGLPNRALFRDRLSHALAQAERNHQLLGILFVDLDQFKTVNDSLGHNIGDQALKACARRIQAHVRRGDTVARLGGDEFTVLIEDAQDLNSIKSVTQKLVRALNQPLTIGEHEIFLGASIGIAVYPLDAQDTSRLLRHADIAMYRAKELGRNRCEFYGAEMGEKMDERRMMRVRLRRAFEGNEFALKFQPQVALKDGMIVGLEVLLRWECQDEPPVLPREFIPILEETGLIIPVSNWVFRQACIEWAEAVKDIKLPLRLSLNLSSRQLRQKDLGDQLADVLAEIDIDPHYLEFEITESTLMEYMGSGTRVLSHLQDLGFRISIDDFGTGYSSLSCLRRFPIDSLKIDKSLIRHIVTDSGTIAIVSSVIKTCRLLGIETIGEGVETVAQAVLLRQLGCNVAQGYLYSPPLLIEEIREFLARRCKKEINRPPVLDVAEI